MLVVEVDIYYSRPGHLSQPDTALRPPMTWLESHRFVTLGVPIAAVCILLLSIILTFMFKRRAPRQTLTARAGLADQQYKQGNYKESIAVYEELLSSVGERPDLLYRLGNAHFRVGDYAEAEKYYLKTIDLQKMPQAIFNLALTLYRLNRPEEAQKYYQMAVSEYQENQPKLSERAREALKIISASEPLTTKREGPQRAKEVGGGGTPEETHISLSLKFDIQLIYVQKISRSSGEKLTQKLKLN